MARRRLHAPARRRAFTLLEVLLAAGIGVLLLAALYVAVDIQLRHSQGGRDVIEQSTLARALVHRMANDVTPAVAPPSPTRFQSSSGQGAGGGSQGGQAATGAAGTGSSASGAASASSSGSGGSSSSSTGSVNYVFTLQGSSSQLTVYLSRIPREVMIPPAQQTDSDNPPETSDLRRISYWLAGDGSLGLARQELLLVTSDDAANVPPDGIGNEGDYVIAPEVTSLSFSYFDGTNWQDSWDGTTPGGDGVTPIGPPMAVAVVLGMVPPGAAPGTPAKTYRYVIPIATANGTTQTSTSSSGTTQQPTGSSSTQNTGS